MGVEPLVFEKVFDPDRPRKFGIDQSLDLPGTGLLSATMRSGSIGKPAIPLTGCPHVACVALTVRCASAIG